MNLLEACALAALELVCVALVLFFGLRVEKRDVATMLVCGLATLLVVAGVHGCAP